MSRCPTFTFQLSIMSKWLAKHISSKVSFKFIIRKRHVYIDIGWPWIWKQYFYLWIWNDERTEIIVLPSFQLVTRLNSQNRNETEFINLLWLIILYMNIVFPIGIIEVSTHEYEVFTLFQSLTRFLTSKYLKLFSTYLVGQSGAMWQTCFSALQNAKKENQLKPKNQVHNRHFMDS